eukprot:7128256-Prymnesium_polylepis.1
MASKLEGKLSDKKFFHFMRLFREAHSAHLEAHLVERERDNFLLQMKLQLVEVERDLYFAQWEASAEREAATTKLAERDHEIARRAVDALRACGKKCETVEWH